MTRTHRRNHLLIWAILTPVVFALLAISILLRSGAVTRVGAVPQPTSSGQLGRAR